MVSLRAAVQKVDSPVSFPFHLGHPAAAYIVYLVPQAASGALADRDVVPQNVARCPAPFQEPGRDSP